MRISHVQFAGTGKNVQSNQEPQMLVICLLLFVFSDLIRLFWLGLSQKACPSLTSYPGADLTILKMFFARMNSVPLTQLFP